MAVDPLNPENENVALVLGSGQDAGVPHIACQCSNCRAAWVHPDRRRLPSSVAVVGRGRQWILLDATPALTEQLARLQQTVPDLKPWPSGIFITHLHLGHYPGLLYLGNEAAAAPGVPVYGSGTVVSFLRRHRPWSDLVAGRYITLNVVEHGQASSLAGLQVSGHRVPHRPDASDMTAWQVSNPEGQTLLYLPDVDLLTDQVMALVAGSDVALVDGSFFDETELPGRDISQIPHPFLRDSSRQLQPLLPNRRIIFTHFNHSNPVLKLDSLQKAQIEALGFELAQDGLKIRLT
jgi:pyrroloquinoline quinone biosynthesis protein B